jgi:hypothetical protein
LAGRRLVAIDGMTLDVADSEVNAVEFGRPGVNKGEQSAFPQARVVAVAECGTRAMFDAVVGPYTTGENTLAADLVERLEPGVLLLADRGFCGYPLWHKAQATGADLLWRAKTNMKPRHVETLADGTWIGELRPGGNAGRHAVPHRVRVIDYTIDDGRTNDTTYRLFTTILDPDDASAVDLAAAYAQRWEIETAFDELKTHQRGPKIVLRSKLVDLVYHESPWFGWRLLTLETRMELCRRRSHLGSRRRVGTPLRRKSRRCVWCARRERRAVRLVRSRGWLSSSTLGSSRCVAGSRTQTAAMALLARTRSVSLSWKPRTVSWLASCVSCGERTTF